MPAIAGAQAVLVGKQIVLFPGDQPGTSERTTATAAYDPATNTWRRLAPLPLTSRGQVWGVTAAAAGNLVTVWETWEKTVQTSANAETGYGGLAVFEYDLEADSWRTAQTTGDGPTVTLPQALWTGRQFLAPAVEQCLVGASCPVKFQRNGYALSASSSSWTAIPHGPVDDLDPQSLWTGAALLDFNTNARTSGPDGTRNPGEAAAWDPSSGAWTRLPDAPHAGLGVASVWTGTRLLVWGTMYRASQAETTGTPQSEAVGLELGP